MAYADPTTKSIWCRQGRYTPGGNSPRYIVVHNTASAASAVHEANNLHNNAGQSSFHYAVDDADVVHCVHDYDAAWAVGAWSGCRAYVTNFESISIEVCNPGTEFSQASKDNLRALVLHLMEYYDIPADRVVRHYDCHSGHKLCPMFYSQHVDKWNELHAYITEPAEAPTVCGYPDVHEGDWCADAVHFVHDKGWMSGYPDGRFGPGDGLMRGQVVCMLAKVAGADLSEPFSDVTASPWYYKALEWAEDEGIVEGNGGEFRPDDPCTRGQLAVMLWRLNGSPQAPAPSDWEGTPGWARDAVSWALAAGAFTTGGIRAEDACTRAEAAQVLYNLYA